MEKQQLLLLIAPSPLITPPSLSLPCPSPSPSHPLPMPIMPNDRCWSSHGGRCLTTSHSSLFVAMARPQRVAFCNCHKVQCAARIQVLETWQHHRIRPYCKEILPFAISVVELCLGVWVGVFLSFFGKSSKLKPRPSTLTFDLNLAPEAKSQHKKRGHGSPPPGCNSTPLLAMQVQLSHIKEEQGKPCLSYTRELSCSHSSYYGREE